MREKRDKDREINNFKQSLREETEAEIQSRCQERANELETYFEEQLAKRDEETNLLKKTLEEQLRKRLSNL